MNLKQALIKSLIEYIEQQLSQNDIIEKGVLRFCKRYNIRTFWNSIYINTEIKTAKTEIARSWLNQQFLKPETHNCQKDIQEQFISLEASIALLRGDIEIAFSALNHNMFTTLDKNEFKQLLKVLYE